ncbi:MAG: hypothetical protein U5N26_02950 [Candidatus Marinimicrobia bacterium]|nr:hypothetical protein [Candidatus Neomarinimicrobiota bacterium]
MAWIFSTFNTDAIKEAEFIAGGFSAEYGGRMSSVLDIQNREGNSREFHQQRQRVPAFDETPV